MPTRLTVLNTADSGYGSLRQDILSSKAGDTIVFSSSLAGSTIQLNSTLEIAHNLTIQGLGATSLTIRRVVTTPFSVFNIDQGVTATLSGLTVSNGNAGGTGGGINSDGNLTLTDCIISGNAAIDGGGVSNGVDGHLTMLRCQVTGNTVDFGSGGGIANAGVMAITNSTIAQDSALKGANGGGLANLLNGQLTITTCTIDANQSAGDDTFTGGGLGGALYVQSTGGSGVTITGTTFDGNSATGVDTNNDATVSATSAGGIYLAAGGLTLQGCTVSNNHSQADATATSDGANNANASAVASGGLVVAGGAVNVVNSTFDGNAGSANASAAATGSGNAFASGVGVGNLSVSGGTVKLVNDTVVNSALPFASASADAPGGSASSSVDAESNLLVAGGTVSVQNTILQTVQGSYTDLGNNLTFMSLDQLGLGALQNNGGPTQTMALLAGSPAIDAGNNAAAPAATDQRGFNRIVNGTIDIGAYEYQPPATTTTLSFQLDTFTARVAGVAPGSNTPAGTVTFVVDGKAAATVPLDARGVAKFRLPPLKGGKHTVQAFYNGNAIGDYVFDPSMSAPLTIL